MKRFLRTVCVATSLGLGWMTTVASAELVNIAVGLPSTGSPNLTDLTPDKANDGITDPLATNPKNMYHSATGVADPWWEVDLGVDQLIEEIILYNRDNGTEENAWQNRLHNVYVEVRSAADAVLWTSPVLNEWDGVTPEVPDNPGPGPFTFDVGGVTGAKVHVRKDTGGESGSAARPWLPLAEVEVMVDDSTLTSVTIDRGTGAMTVLNNSGSPLNIVGYSITSEVGALDQAGWTPIKGNYDALPGNGGTTGDGTIDVDDNWTILTAPGANSDLSEVEFDGGDGGILANGVTYDLGSSAWIQNSEEDLVAKFLMAGGAVQDFVVNYVGGNGSPYERSDLDFDNDIDADDYLIYVAGLKTDLSSLSPAQAYQQGDLDYDGVNGVIDFGLFKSDFENFPGNGAGSFAAMLASVPEPSSALLLALGSLGIAFGRRRRHGESVGDNQTNFEERTSVQKLATHGTQHPNAIRRRLVACFAFLAVCLISVQASWAVTINGALNRPATGSSELNGVFLAELANDGDTSSSSFFHTSTNDFDPSWEVDLQVDFFIDDILLYNRADGTGNYGNRLNNVFVEVLDASDTQVFLSPIFNPWDGTGDPALITNPGVGPHTFSIGGVIGRKVRVFKDPAHDGSEWLPLAEVEVLGEFEDQPLIQLAVNPNSGAMQLSNKSTIGIAMDYYSITGDESLDPNNWDSLDAQDYDATGAGVGQSWDEAGGASSSDLTEIYLASSSTLAPGTSVSLGEGYNATLDKQDLTFEYRDPTTGGVVEGFVDYIEPGDMNDDGFVNDADVNPFVQALTNRADYALAFPNVDADFVGDFNGNGRLDLGDVGDFKAAVQVAGQASGAGNSVPEPSSLCLLALATLGLVTRRRTRCNSSTS